MTITQLDHLPDHLCVDRKGVERVTAHFPMGVSAHYLSLIEAADDPIAKQVIPDRRELNDPEGHADPLNEEAQAPVTQIIHRYPHRVIFLVSNQCAAYCRFCMRKRRIIDAAQVTPEAIDEGIDYIRRNTAVNEVILSGGDPLMLTDSVLAEILERLHRLPHIRMLRIHTRMPSSHPQRITSDTAAILARFHPLYMNIHINHPDEITARTKAACATLADAGIPLGSQTVLLQGVNDDAGTLRHLFQGLLEIRVRPYYLHQLDRVPGTAHFQVPLPEALKLTASLRGKLSGQAMPHFMIDLPGGGGKMELIDGACIETDKDQWVIRNFEGRLFKYPLK